MTTPSIHRYALHLLTTVACMVVGCQSPRVDGRRSPSDRPPSEATPATVSQGVVASDASWEAIKSALRDARFRLDRVDRASGVITTSPMSSQHFFEFWRHDVDTFHDWIDATINPLRRRVTVTLASEGAEQTATLTVEVRKERLSAPDRQFNSSGAAYEFFGSRLPSTTGKPKISASDETWVDAGRDSAMEAWLLKTMFDGSPSVEVIESLAP